MTALRLLLAAALLPAGAAAALVSGTVRTTTGAGFPSAVVQAWTSSGTLASQTTSNAAGSWTLSLPAGSYRFLAYDPNGAFATDFYRSATSFDTSTVTALDECAALSGVDFTLSSAGYVTGTVGGTGNGVLPGITAAAYNLDGTLRATATTNGSGQYRLSLAPGTYRIVAWDDARRWATQMWNATTDFDAAANVSLVPGQTVPGVDFVLPPAGVLAGTVRAARGGAPLAGIAIRIYTSGGAPLASAATATDGSWASAVPAGEAKVVAYDPKLAYRTAFYPNATSLANAAALTARAGETLGGLDFALTAAGSSTPTELFVVAAASSPGANNTYFRTELQVLNLSTETAHLALTWLPGGGGDNSGAAPVTRELAGGAELVVPDAVAALFGASGGGAIRIASDVPVLASSRTATPAPSGGGYGLGVPAVSAARAVVSGRIAAVRDDAAYRTNVGFLNPGTQPLTIALALSDANGAPLATGTVTLGPLGQRQLNTVGSYLGVSAIPQGTLRVTAPAPFFAYSTVIDQATGDSVFVAADAD